MRIETATSKDSGYRNSADKNVCPTSGVALVGLLEPALDLQVEIGQRAERDAVRDAILFCQTAGIVQARGERFLAQRKAEVDPLLRCGLDLSEHMPPIKGHDRLAGANPHVIAQR